jgi:hypothetical protein
VANKIFWAIRERSYDGRSSNQKPKSFSRYEFRKKGAIMNEVLIQIILIGLILAIFLMATSDKINARGVRQQVIEKQTALLIDSAVSGMSFEIMKTNLNGVVQNVELDGGRVHVTLEGLVSFEGYPYFSVYSVAVREEENKFVVEVK